MKRRFKYLWLLAAVALIAAASLAGRSRFHQWRERRLLRHAQEFLAQGDSRGASFGALRVLRENPRSVPACEILAQIAENARSPAAILWRAKLAEIEPGRAERLLTLARTAGGFGETSVAEQALARVNARDRDTVAYHQTAAAVAIRVKTPAGIASAIEHLRQARQIEPENAALQLNLATLELGGDDPAATEAARTTLEKLRRQPEFHLPAIRALLADARRQGDAARSLSLAGELHAVAAATPDDQLLYIEELQHAQAPAFEETLAALQKNAGAQPAAVSTLMFWLNAHGLAARTAAWSRMLPEAVVQTQTPVPLAVAEADTALGDWESLRALVAKANWGPLNFLRLAIQARTIEETARHERGADFQLCWRQALDAAGGDPAAAAMLARLVEGWGWREQAEQAWWLAANRGSLPRAALLWLHQLYSEEKNASELYRVVRRLRQLEPDNLVMQNDAASLALLLNQDAAEACRLAAQAYRAAPSQPVIVSTYALSLHRQHRTREAVQLMAALPADALRQPAIAACYGGLLAADGEAEKARPYLDIARQHQEELFPEEIALATTAAAASSGVSPVLAR